MDTDELVSYKTYIFFSSLAMKIQRKQLPAAESRTHDL